MGRHTCLIRALLLGAVLLLPLPALSAPAKHPESTERGRYCRQNPDDCTDVTEERRAQLREWCEDNPVDCDEERQALMELHREKLQRTKHARRHRRDASMEPGRRAPPATHEHRKEERPSGPPR